jgi:hypothetical protein
MKKTKIRLLLGPALVPVLVAAVLFAGNTTPSFAKVKGKLFTTQLAWETGKAVRPKWAQSLSSGTMYNLLLASGTIEARARALGVGPAAPYLSSVGSRGCPKVFLGGQGPSNVRVNQDCSLRRQAEEAMAVNPTNKLNIIAGQNDSRMGYNQCGFDYSMDAGLTWGDFNPPFHQVILADGRIGDFCSDPTVAFDSQGNAYAGGIELSLDGTESSIIVAKSNAPIGGAFYHSPDSSLGAFQTYADSPMGVVIDEFDVDGCIGNDKELMAADSHGGSPKADNVYMAWTRFDFCTGEGVGGHSPIYFSQSTDGGASWSDGIEISGSNSTYCTDFSGEGDPYACDQDQGPHPVVGSDGTVYVAFGNGNTPNLGFNQHMIVSCAPGDDCSDPNSWSGPNYVTDDQGGQPIAASTDSTNGCPGGRQCLPPNGYRMDDFVEGSVSVDNFGNLYFVWGDYRDGIDSVSCPFLGDELTSTPPCDNSVFFVYSEDGGATWTDPVNVSPAAVSGETAQWMPWSAAGPNGKTLWVAYYTREYGNCETTGCNDIVLAKIANPRNPSIAITYSRETTKSMPNLVPATNPYQAGFLGDYMWVTVDTSGRPYVVWADTRSRGQSGVTEEDIYFAS